MTNKPMLSVERKLILRIADHCKFWVDHPYLEAIADVEVELRALLDKPVTESEVERLERRCKNAELALKVQTENCAALKAAQHQGEPVAWLNIATGHVTTSAVVVMDWDDEKEQVQSLYAEQPASVAVVMPERRKPDGWQSLTSQDLGWNAALAEVARLNGVKL